MTVRARGDIKIGMTKTRAMIMGLIAAAMLPAIYLAIAFPLAPDGWTAVIGSFVVFLFFSTAATLILAVPLLLLLQKLRLIAWWSAMIAGGLVGAAALLLVSSMESYHLQPITQFVVLGSISGLSFWIFWRLGRS